MSKTYIDRIKKPGKTDLVYFYPPEYYVFDNFSSFQIEYDGYLWPTSEHAYQASMFKETFPAVFLKIKKARSAHDAYKLAKKHKVKVPKDWNTRMKTVMKDILRHKIDQHPYVLKKLLESGKREIIEDSWRDSTWGWGEYKDGNNLLGKIWMELREEYQKKTF